MSLDQKIVPISIVDEMKSAYIDYSMSVIVSRALPDVRDGLKPVHRRVLFGMNELGVFHNKKHLKSARIVGEVLGKYHPHGDSSVYDTMVRMAQQWSLRYMLVDGQGNFGSVDGDSPAAMRYTEARLAKISDDLLADLDKETVKFQLNFDDTLKEPTVLPTRIPNLIVNGASGIAVGMATNMLPHNLTEVINGLIAFIDNEEISIDDLMQFIKAPDFPTGGTIYGLNGVREAYLTGRGRVVVRGKSEIEIIDGRETIIISEIPYQVNKSTLIQKIAELANDKKIDGISDVRDESDRDGMRIVVQLRRDANSNVVLSHLYKYTALQSSFGVNNICLVDGRPRLLNLKELMTEFYKFRLEVITKRSIYDKRKAEERAHILHGLLAALDSKDKLDEIIARIRASKTTEEARNSLLDMDFSVSSNAVDSFLLENPLQGNRLSEEQAKAILEMRLQRLTGLERDKILTEFKELIALIADLTDILESEERRRQVCKDELIEVRDKYGDQRRTDIIYAEGEISIEDMIKNEKVIVTISHLGYIKRTPMSEYRTQSRGGVGAKAADKRNEDFMEHLFDSNTHDYLLLFTQKGRCYWIRVYELPEGNKTSKGRAIQNLLQLGENDKIKAFIRLENLNDKEFLENHFIMFATKHGLVKKTPLEAYSRPRTGGIAAITFREEDELIEAKLTKGNSHILLASKAGKAIRFVETDVRSMGRTATGVKGMDIEGEKDELIGMVCVEVGDNKLILAVSEKGIGKRTDIDEYRIQTRGGKGIKTINVTEKTGQLISVKAVTDDDDLMIINKSGLTIRMAVKELPISGRATQGVKLINIKSGDSIADVSLIVDGQLEVGDEPEETESTDNVDKTEE
jgi:DNA gyrase subunit A